MKFEEEAVSFIEKCEPGREHEYSMDIKYFALDLIAETFDYETLAKSAVSQGVNHRLGFLCELTARAAAELNESEASKRLYNLVNALYTQPNQWQYLDPELPDFGKRMLDVSEQNELNKKWYVKSTLTYIDIVKWANVHSVKNNVTASQRKTAR